MTYVLLPGAGGSAWYWHLVAARLRDRGREVLAVDLPAADDTAGLPEYADVVVRAAAGLPDVTLVAQSLAGFVAPLVCDRRPVSLVVLVNAMVPAPGESPGAWWEATGQLAAMQANDVRQGRPPSPSPGDPAFDLATHFLHDVPPAVAAAGEEHQGEQSGAVFGSPGRPGPWPDVPTRVLTGRDDRLFPAEFQRRVARERLGITPDEIDGGHLLALARPIELADRLEAYRATLP